MILVLALIACQHTCCVYLAVARCGANSFPGSSGDPRKLSSLSDSPMYPNESVFFSLKHFLPSLATCSTIRLDWEKVSGVLFSSVFVVQIDFKSHSERGDFSQFFTVNLYS